MRDAQDDEEDRERGRDLESQISFLERSLDHVRSELAQLWKEIGTLGKRVDRLARALEGLEGQDDGEGFSPGPPSPPEPTPRGPRGS